MPGEDDDVTVHCSTQHPSEIQHKVAHVLGVPSHAVTVEMRRMGGGFGGKESQGNLPAAAAALVAKLHRPAGQVLLRPRRRHDASPASGTTSASTIASASTTAGRILGVEFEQATRCGMSFDLSLAIADRAMFHADNAYYLPAAAHHLATAARPTPQSNTAFRGFGGPQGMVGMERVIDEIAHTLGLRPARRAPRQFLRRTWTPGRPQPRNVTPYHQTVEDCVIQEIVDELEASSDYRRAARRRSAPGTRRARSSSAASR